MAWSDSKARTLRSYKQGRQALIEALGGRCALCGRLWTVDKDGKRQPLQVDHVDGRTWSRAERDRMNRWSRLARYKRELAAGIRLRALCKRCNSGHQPGRNA